MTDETPMEVVLPEGGDATPKVTTESTPAPPEAHVEMQFDDAEQQQETATLGMWVFLITEIMFFGGLFVAYLVYRNLHFQAFVLGSRALSYGSGTAMTAILILSSLTMALSVHAAQTGKQPALRRNLWFTMLLGISFLVLKGLEYHDHLLKHEFPGSNFHFDAPAHLAHPVQLFFVLYWCMTGLHALHMLIGIGLVIWLLTAAKRMTPEYHNPVEIIGLYWHFVDIIWIYLYPLLYLIDRWR